MPNKISRRKFLKYAAGGVLGAGAIGLGGTAYSTQIEPDAVETTHITIPLAHLPAAFDGMTIVQISDWHLGEWMTLKRILVVAQQTNDLKPDVILITGDFLSMTWDDTYDEVTAANKALTAPEGIYATFGNHDHWTSAKNAKEAVDAAGTTQLLLNAHVAIQRGSDTLYIAGVDDIWEKKNDLSKALDGIPSDATVILMAHEPDYADEVAQTKRVGLQLSGHSHGGQVRLPFKGALVLPFMGEKYDMGLYNVNGMALYVNRGLGMVEPYVRFGCRPEITHFTLRAAIA
ncbi:MAG: metallophosphoesterase [Chloroflexota bacterium]